MKNFLLLNIFNLLLTLSIEAVFSGEKEELTPGGLFLNMDGLESIEAVFSVEKEGLTPDGLFLNMDGVEFFSLIQESDHQKTPITKRPFSTINKNNPQNVVFKKHQSNSSLKQDLDRAINILSVFKENISTIKDKEKIEFNIDDLEKKIANMINFLNEINTFNLNVSTLIEKFKERGLPYEDQLSSQDMIKKFLSNQFDNIHLPEPFERPDIYFTNSIDILNEPTLAKIFSLSFQGGDYQTFENLSLVNKKWRRFLVPESKFVVKTSPSSFFSRSQFKKIYFDYCLKTSKKFFKDVELATHLSFNSKSQLFITFKDLLLEIGVSEELMDKEAEDISTFLKAIHHMSLLFTNCLTEKKSTKNLLISGYQFYPRQNKIYFGQMKNDHFENKGTVLSIEKNSLYLFYFGSFSKGKFSGIGTKSYDNGCIYRGEYKESLRCGKGALYQPDGAFYSGDFINGKKEGFGKQKYVNGSIYEGEWLADMPNGRGVFINNEKDFYTFDGNWLNGKKSGFGQLVCSLGCAEGNWENNAFKGKVVPNSY